MPSSPFAEASWRILAPSLKDAHGQLVGMLLL